MEQQGSGLAELFDVEPLSPDASDWVDWEVPYIFDAPFDWNDQDVTLSTPDLFASEGLLFSTDFGVPTLLIGHLVADADAFQKSIISPDDVQETIELEAPDRSLTIFLNQDGNLGLVGIVPNDQGATSFWLMEPSDFLVTEDINRFIAMFYTIRTRNFVQ